MKKTVLIFLGTVLSLALTGQYWPVFEAGEDRQIFEPFNWRLDSIVIFNNKTSDFIRKTLVASYEYKDTLVIQKNFNPGCPEGGICPWFVKKVEYYYDASGALTEFNAGPGKCLLGGCWGGRYVYSYNQDGTLASIVLHFYNEETNEWDPWGRNQYYSYDDEKNLIEEIHLMWPIGSEYNEVESIIHTYSGRNRVASYGFSGYPPERLEWKKEREFDQYGNCIREIKYDYSDYSWEEDTSWIEYEYDLLGELLLKETGVSGDGDISECRYTYNNGDLVKVKRNIGRGALFHTLRQTELYYYRNQSNTKVPENTLRKIEIYPNPVVNTVTIRTLSEDVNYASIIDLNGRIHMSIEWIGPIHQLNLSSFRKGIYFITVRSREQVWTEKIIKL